MSDNAPGCAVITGGAGGIGIAAARRLAARGMRVALWDKSLGAIDIARSIEGALALEVDVTDPRSVLAATEQTVSQAGGIEVLVNSAGITGPNAAVDEYLLRGLAPGPSLELGRHVPVLQVRCVR